MSSLSLFVNGKSVGKSDTPQYSFLHTFKKVAYQPGEIKAVSYSADGAVESEASHQTAGQPDHLQLTLLQNPDGGMRADGADLALIQVEVLDAKGQRCPLDNRIISWTLEGEGEWRGGIGKSPNGDNYILDTDVPVEAGVGRVLVRSTTTPGTIRLRAHAKGMEDAVVEWDSHADKDKINDGMSAYIASDHLKGVLDRGETPATPSFTEKKQTIAIASATAGANSGDVSNSFDDNELSEWKNDGQLSTAWITYELAEPAAIDEISIKLTGWRQRSYPIEVLADNELIWKGNTDKSLGYISLFIDKPVKAKRYTIHQTGSASDKDAFGQVTELAGGPATELDLYKAKDGDKVRGELRIIEIDFLRKK